ncbi:MAG: twin-arginine translocase subunit TatC [Candidatus Auribacterota bacterium]|nr:twin-arginine translocase subunit TatC [Candidatus Auribacterota bacterium]
METLILSLEMRISGRVREEKSKRGTGRRMERRNNSGDHLEEKPFLEHLEDLRRLILKILITWGAASLAAFVLSNRVFAVLQQPLARMTELTGGGEETFTLRSLSPPEVFLMSMKLSLLIGFIVGLPLILYFIGNFLLPALKNREKKYLVPAFSIGGGLFFSGVLFAYWVVLPLSLKFFWNYTERLAIRPEWTLEHYLSLAGKLLIGFGLVFELPVVILLLAFLGIIDYDTLRRKRAYVVVIIFILAALLTPPDVITQVMMAIPLLILFEICILITRFINKNNYRG